MPDTVAGRNAGVRRQSIRTRRGGLTLGWRNGQEGPAMGGLPTLLEISAMGCRHFPVGRVIEKDEILRGVQTRHHDVMKRAFETPFTKADDERASFGELLLQASQSAGKVKTRSPSRSRYCFISRAKIPWA